MSIKLEGACGVERAEELQQTILQGIESGETSLDLSGVTDVDLSFFQLIHSVKKDNERHGRDIALPPTLPRDFSQQAAWCGLETIISDK